MKIDLELELLTPLFSKGMYDDIPEIRAPSIRGQLHHWFRALGGTIEDERAIFGGIARKDVWKDHASPLVVRTEVLEGDISKSEPTLPHKQGGHAAPRAAYLPGTRFRIHIRDRLGGLGAHEDMFRQTLEAWLLMGTLGARGTRAAGSFDWTGSGGTLTPPSTISDYRAVTEGLLAGTRLTCRILEPSFASEREARICASDTIGGPANRGDMSDLEAWHYPLGTIDRTNGRKTSPLKLRLVRVDAALHLLAVWDERAGNTLPDLLQVAQAMNERDKLLGRMLIHAFA